MQNKWPWKSRTPCLPPIHKQALKKLKRYLCMLVGPQIFCIDISLSFYHRKIVQILWHIKISTSSPLEAIFMGRYWVSMILLQSFMLNDIEERDIEEKKKDVTKHEQELQRKDWKLSRNIWEIECVWRPIPPP